MISLTFPIPSGAARSTLRRLDTAVRLYTLRTAQSSHIVTKEVPSATTDPCVSTEGTCNPVRALPLLREVSQHPPATDSHVTLSLSQTMPFVWPRRLGETFSKFVSKFAGVGRKEKFRRNLPGAREFVARLGSGMRKVVWILDPEMALITFGQLLYSGSAYKSLL